MPLSWCIILLFVGVSYSYRLSKPEIIGWPGRNIKLEDETQCGRSFIDNEGWRIVGGTNAPRGSFPWQVSIQKDKVHFCGATIINKHWLLTAAHCFDDEDEDSLKTMRAVVGDTKLNRREGTERAHQLRAAFVHSGYDEKEDTPMYDIALIKLKQPVRYNKYVQRVCLNRKSGRFNSNHHCYMTGWGDTRGPEDSQSLQQLKSRVVPQTKCNRNWGGDVVPGNICAGLGNRGVCDGDSGGPFQCRSRDGLFYQVGITSYATENCDDYGYPSVFTRVSKYVKWIDYVISKY